MAKGGERGAPAGNVDGVVERLRAMIFDRKLPPGRHINERELATQLGVSVEIVKEALARLQASRLIRQPTRGAFVEELSAGEFEDIYGMREVLEEHAARIAAPLLTNEDLQNLDEILRELVQLASTGDVDRSLSLHRELHFTIYRAAGASHLLECLSQLWDLSSRYRQLQLHTAADRLKEVLPEIRTIVATCHRRDPEGLALLIRFKIHQTRVGLRDRLRGAVAAMSGAVDVASDSSAAPSTIPAGPLGGKESR